VLIPINKLYDCIQYHKIRIRTDEGLINVTNTVNSQQSGMYDHDRSVNGLSNRATVDDFK